MYLIILHFIFTLYFLCNLFFQKHLISKYFTKVIELLFLCWLLIVFTIDIAINYSIFLNLTLKTERFYASIKSQNRAFSTTVFVSIEKHLNTIKNDIFHHSICLSWKQTKTFELITSIFKKLKNQHYNWMLKYFKE